MLMFFGGQSPFSNFHNSKFMVNGVIYDCNEHFYVRGKAVFAEDIDAINPVMSVDTPQNIKRISDTLNCFRTEHSLEYAALELIDRVIYEMDNDKIPFSIFLYLSKTFDTHDHTILLEKLKYYGGDGAAIEQF